MSSFDTIKASYDSLFRQNVIYVDHNISVAYIYTANGDSGIEHVDYWQYTEALSHLASGNYGSITRNKAISHICMLIKISSTPKTKPHNEAHGMPLSSAMKLRKQPYRFDKNRQITRQKEIENTQIATLPQIDICNFIEYDENDGGEKWAFICMHWLEHGGAEKLGLKVTTLLKEKGYKIALIFDKKGAYDYLDTISDDCDLIVDLPVLNPGRVRDLDHNTITSLIKKLRPQVVSIHHCDVVYHMLPLIRTLIPEAVIFDSTHIIESNGGGFVNPSIRYSHYLSFHHVISKELMAYYNIHGIKRDKVCHGHLLRDMDNAVKEVQSDDEHREQRFKKELKIAYVGRMTFQKRPYLLAKLMKSLDSKLTKHVSFDLVGDGPLLNMVKWQVENYAKSAIVSFHDANTNVNSILKESDILLICSENEGLTLVAMEALRNNCLVISADVGSQEEICQPIFNRRPQLFHNEVVEFITNELNDYSTYDKYLKNQQSLYKKLLKTYNWKETLNLKLTS